MIGRILNKLRKIYLFNSNIGLIRRNNISFEKPNYLYKENFGDNPVIIDVGCASHPDFSLHMINKFGYHSVGVDPTRKHFDSLKYYEEKLNGKFKHLPFAVADKTAELTFNESVNHDSGSLMDSHTNVKQDEIIQYKVKALTIGDLIKELGVDKIDYLKLDLEGIEYSLLKDISKDDLLLCEQIFIEFHHHCIEEYKIKDTLNLVDRIEKFGFKSFSLDKHNFLFVKN